MELQRICPTHNLPLKNFKGIGKASGKPYENWKCTYKDNSGYCDFIEWVNQEELTKKFTQTPNGVVETDELWPTDGPQTLNLAHGEEISPKQVSWVDVIDSLSRLHVKINKLLGNAEENRSTK